MWKLRFYSPHDDELVAEVELPQMRLEHASELLGYAPTKLGSTPLTEEEFATLCKAFKTIEIAGVDVFLDFDQDSQPAPLERRPKAAAIA